MHTVRQPAVQLACQHTSHRTDQQPVANFNPLLPFKLVQVPSFTQPTHQWLTAHHTAHNNPSQSVSRNHASYQALARSRVQPQTLHSPCRGALLCMLPYTHVCRYRAHQRAQANYALKPTQTYDCMQPLPSHLPVDAPLDHHVHCSPPHHVVTNNITYNRHCITTTAGLSFC